MFTILFTDLNHSAVFLSNYQLNIVSSNPQERKLEFWALLSSKEINIYSIDYWNSKREC